MSTVSIFIRTRNEAAALPATLRMVQAQERRPDEIVVLDNESEDGTARLASKAGAVVHTMVRNDFSYGRALNLATSLASGEIVVFLSAHSPPRDTGWLSSLVEPIEQGQALVTFGRQVPVPGVNPLEEWMLRRAFPAHLSPWLIRLGVHRPAFSNANAAVPATLLRECPFREDLAFAEDAEWVTRLSARGVQAVYRPDAVVFHSHAADGESVFGRMRQVGTAMRQMDQGRFYQSRLACAAMATGVMAADAVYCVARGYWRTLSQIPAYRSAYFRGLYRGITGCRSAETRLKASVKESAP